jgi:hypothetical protein
LAQPRMRPMAHPGFLSEAVRPLSHLADIGPHQSGHRHLLLPPSVNLAGDRLAGFLSPTFTSCPIRRLTVPIKGAETSSHLCSFPRARESARTTRFFVGDPPLPPPRSFQFGRHRKVSPLVSGPYPSPSPSAPLHVFLLVNIAANRRSRPWPKHAGAWSSSSGFSSTFQEGELDSVDANKLPSPFCASSTSPPSPEATGAQPPSTAEPSAAAHKLSNDLTVNAGESPSQICSHR